MSSVISLPCAVSSDRSRWEDSGLMLWIFHLTSSDYVVKPKQIGDLCQHCLLVFESAVNKDAILSLYLECWGVWTCDSCRRFAARSFPHWWWWLSPGNTSTDMYFHFIFFDQTGPFYVRTNYWSVRRKKLHYKVVLISAENGISSPYILWRSIIRKIWFSNHVMSQSSCTYCRRDMLSLPIGMLKPLKFTRSLLFDCEWQLQSIITQEKD